MWYLLITKKTKNLKMFFKNAFFISLALIHLACFLEVEAQKGNLSDFDMQIMNYLSSFVTKLENHKLTKEDEKVIAFLMRVIIMRKQQIDMEQKESQPVYWYSRQGRSKQN